MLKMSSFGVNRRTEMFALYSSIIEISRPDHLVRLKSTKFDFGWGSAPDHTGEAHSAPQIP